MLVESEVLSFRFESSDLHNKYRRPTFKRNLDNLGKKYHNIRKDIKRIIQLLETGELLGNRITGIHYQVFKVRVKNSDIQKVKSGGYRLIYYVKTAERIILLSIYTKSEKTNISNKEIINIIQHYKQE